MNGEARGGYLTSKENPLLKHVRLLFRDRPYRYEAGEFMIEGYRVFDSALSVKTVLLRGETKPPAGCPAEAAVFRVKESVFDRLSEDGPGQGVAGICSIPAEGELRGGGRYVYLDALQDPGNLGTIVRTSAAFALDGVILGRGCADPFSPKVVRSAAGAVFKIPFLRRTDFSGLKGYPLLAADMSGLPLGTFERPDAFVLVVGNEGGGVSPEAAAAADFKVCVPMKGGTESLNAAVAAGIVLYELAR